MADIRDLLNQLWDGFKQLNPQADQIHALLLERGETIVNDHIAFRTFDDTRVDWQILARPFLADGYEVKDSYHFEQKKLDARHLAHSDPSLPKIFISQLQLDEFSAELRHKVRYLLDQLTTEQLAADDFCASGRGWSLRFDEYQQLATESEYAGWVAAYGYCANHFTVFVNELQSFNSLTELNSFLKEQGFALNIHGGEIKGSPSDYLEQSSTLAPEIGVSFADGVFAIPGCYYEFAQRYPMPDGQLFEGFVTKSADNIFRSTDRR